jgi:hypothetical protein
LFGQTWTWFQKKFGIFVNYQVNNRLTNNQHNKKPEQMDLNDLIYKYLNDIEELARQREQLVVEQ